MNKKSFVIHTDMLDCLETMTDQARADLFYMIKQYHNQEELMESPDVAALSVFPLFVNMFEREHEKYEKKCNANRENGKKGGRPKKEANPKKPNKTDGLLEKPKKPHSDSDSDSDIIKEKKRTAFRPPSLEEIRAFSNENNLNLDSQAFRDYYESNGWIVGRTKMKNWKAAARNWSRRDTNAKHQRPAQSSAERLQNKLNDIAAKDIRENGFVDSLGSRDIQDISQPVSPEVVKLNRRD